MQSARNPDGVPKEAVDQIRAGTAYHRAQFYKDITIPFYGYNRPGAVVSEGIRENWWRQGMMGAATAHYQCVKVLSETEFYDDLALIDIPVLVMHTEVLSRPSARHAHHACGPDQCRPAVFHTRMRGL
jgi:non-heme chloroperoxidase